MRYALHLSYDGTAYHGWQRQPNAPTVQETIERCLSTILRTQTEIVGAGRTDTGVHALMMVAHFDTDTLLDCPSIKHKLNSFLPSDIAIYDVTQESNDFHARYSAVSRTYHYRFTLRKNPFISNRFAATLPADIDISAMNEAAKLLCGTRDFTSFSKLHTDVSNNICELGEAYFVRLDEQQLLFVITANRFLRNMVRAIVGTLVLVGIGKLKPADINAIVEARDRSHAADSAPACGLFLAEIKY